jgi:hypothetical protein
MSLSATLRGLDVKAPPPLRTWLGRDAPPLPIASEAVLTMSTLSALDDIVDVEEAFCEKSQPPPPSNPFLTSIFEAAQETPRPASADGRSVLRE